MKAHWLCKPTGERVLGARLPTKRSDWGKAKAGGGERASRPGSHAAIAPSPRTLVTLLATAHVFKHSLTGG